MIQALLGKLRKWVYLTAPVYVPIMIAIFAIFFLSVLFKFELPVKAKEIMGMLVAIGLYTVALADILKQIPVSSYNRLELIIFVPLYMFFHVWLVVLAVALFLPHGLPECFAIPHIVLILMAGPAIVFVSAKGISRRTQNAAENENK